MVQFHLVWKQFICGNGPLHPKKQKPEKSFHFFKAGYFVWEFSAFLVTSWESFVFARSGSSESNLFVGNRLLALCASKKKKKIVSFLGNISEKKLTSGSLCEYQKAKCFHLGRIFVENRKLVLPGPGQEPKPLWPWTVFLICFKYFCNIFLFGRNNNLLKFSVIFFPAKLGIVFQSAWQPRYIGEYYSVVWNYSPINSLICN